MFVNDTTVFKGLISVISLNVSVIAQAIIPKIGYKIRSARGPISCRILIWTVKSVTVTKKVRKINCHSQVMLSGKTESRMEICPFRYDIRNHMHHTNT